VAVIGAGGIGFDVSEFLLHDSESKPASLDVGKFLQEWGIDGSNEHRGGLSPEGEKVHPPPREIYLLQRKKGKLGAGLGKTTGWIHRTSLKKGGVNMVNGVEYVKVDDQGLHIRVGKDKAEKVLQVDHVVVCAGQEPLRELEEPLKKAGLKVFRIGGSELAAELDAKRAIDQGTRLAAQYETAPSGAVYTAPPSFEAKLIKGLGLMN
jgi:2,4-dienoyl-CoA reductase (NADPH2)